MKNHRFRQPHSNWLSNIL